MKAVRFRIQNFRNIDDSGWIPLERVTNFVGRNESGKTTLLKAFHKFNPAIPEPYDAQREFPRDRYTRDYIAGGSKGGEWPVCSVAFTLADDLKVEISTILGKIQEPPQEAILTRYYDGSLSFDYEPALEEKQLSPEGLLKGLEAFAGSARRLESPSPEKEEATAQLRMALVSWATVWQDRLKDVADLRTAEGSKLLATMRTEVESNSGPQTADMIEALQKALSPVLDSAKLGPVLPRISKLVESRLPVLIYFENYGILDSAIWLPRFLEDQRQSPTNARVRTITAMFKHVGLNPIDVAELGKEDAQTSRNNKQQQEDGARPVGRGSARGSPPSPRSRGARAPRGRRPELTGGQSRWPGGLSSV
jgi:hypothetical protein